MATGNNTINMDAINEDNEAAVPTRPLQPVVVQPTLRTKQPIFDPSSNQSGLRFLREYDHHATALNWGDEHKLQYFFYSLHDKARTWYDQLDDNTDLDTWQHLRNAFLSAFEKGFQPAEMVARVSKLAQGTSSVREYKERVVETLESLQICANGLPLGRHEQLYREGRNEGSRGYHDIALSMYFLKGLRREINDHMTIIEFRNFKHIVETAIQVENRLRDMTNRAQVHSVQPESAPIDAVHGGPPRRRKSNLPHTKGATCNFCKRFNHTEDQCQIKINRMKRQSNHNAAPLMSVSDDYSSQDF